MKKLFQILALSIILSFCSAVAFAQTGEALNFYVCSGTGFNLVAAANASSYDTYIWNDVTTSTAVLLPTTTGTLVVDAVTITPGGGYQTKKYSLSVFKAGQSCYSDPVAYNVYILPVPTVSLNTIIPQCVSSVNTLTLTATVGTVALPTGVTASAFSWKKENVAVDPAVTGNTLTFSSASTVSTTTYSVSVTYAVPSGNAGVKYADCVATASSIVTVNPKPDTPIVSIN